LKYSSAKEGGREGGREEGRKEGRKEGKGTRVRTIEDRVGRSWRLREEKSREEEAKMRGGNDGDDGAIGVDGQP